MGIPPPPLSSENVKAMTTKLNDDAGILASRADNLPCNRNGRANTFSSLNFASEQNGSPEDRYFSFYVTHKGLSDHKAS